MEGFSKNNMIEKKTNILMLKAEDIALLEFEIIKNNKRIDELSDLLTEKYTELERLQTSIYEPKENENVPENIDDILDKYQREYTEFQKEFQELSEKNSLLMDKKERLYKEYSENIGFSKEALDTQIDYLRKNYEAKEETEKYLEGKEITETNRTQAQLLQQWHRLN